MLIPDRHRRAFYQIVSGKLANMHRYAYPGEGDADDGYSGLSSVETFCALLAMSHLEHLDDVAGCRRWLAEAAACSVDLQERTEDVTGDAFLRTAFRIGVAGDEKMMRRAAAGYLKTPHGAAEVRGALRRYWPFARALALFFRGGETARADALGVLRGFAVPSGPPKDTAAWFEAMRALGIEVLGARRPDPLPHFRAVALANQGMWGRSHNDAVFEAWFAEMAMAFVPAAIVRGWRVPDEAPHPTMPLALFRLPAMKIVVRPFKALRTLKPTTKLVAEIALLANPKPKLPAPKPGTSKPLSKGKTRRT